MNTIYDGSYVLGQTSATNFQAGPGISITQPSEGTVRIANDETVLWDSNGSTNQITTSATFNLSEPFTAFNKIEVYVAASFGDCRYIKSFDISQSSNGRVRLSLSEPGMGSDQDANLYIDRSNLYFNSDSPSTVTGYGAGSRLGINGTTISYTNRRGAAITKIVGINRISGGNE